MIDYLSEEVAESEPVAILAYYYLASGRENMQTVSMVMRSLTFQLNAQDSKLYGHLLDLHEKCQHKGGDHRQPRYDELEPSV